MPRTTINQQQVARTGLTPAYAAVDQPNGNQFSNDGTMFLHVKNGSASPITVTIATPGLVDGLAVADLAVTVTNAQERMIGPFPPNIYNQAGGLVYVDYSAGASVTAGLFRL